VNRFYIITSHKAISVALVFLYAAPAMAHEWYVPSCCSNQDCAAIPASSVTEAMDGYEIELDRGDHPMVTQRGSWFVPYDEVHGKNAPDGKFHACIHPESKRMICFHEPHRGY